MCIICQDTQVIFVPANERTRNKGDIFCVAVACHICNSPREE